MKKMAVVVCFLISSCVYVPKITLQSNLSSAFSGRNIAITNATNFYASTMINCEKVALIAPGDTIYANWFYDFDSTQIPVAVTFYKNAGEADYLGAAVRTFYSSGYNQSFSWVIRPSDIRSRSSLTSKIGPAKANPKSYQFHFPRVSWLSTTIVQFINNSRYAAKINLNGEERKIVPPGQVYCLTLNTLGSTGYSSGGQANLTALFLDEGRLAGSFSRTLYVPDNQIQAYQFIVSNGF